MHTEALKDAYLTAKRAGWAEATHLNRLAHLKKFAEACPDLPTEPEPIETFLDSIDDPRYKYNVWCSIRLLYQWAKKRRRVKDPCRLVEAPKKPDPRPYYLEPDELAKLLNHPHHPRDRALLWLLADTGMRRGEAHSMTAENMRDNPDGSGWAYVTGKTGPRWVPVSALVWDMVRAIAPPSGPIWRSIRGQHKPLTVNGIGVIVWTCFARAGLLGRQMTAHRLRHTFCTLWDGADSDGMDVVGHSDWRTWRIYKHTRNEPLRRAHAQHSPIAHLHRAPI